MLTNLLLVDALSIYSYLVFLSDFKSPMSDVCFPLIMMFTARGLGVMTIQPGIIHLKALWPTTQGVIGFPHEAPWLVSSWPGSAAAGSCEPGSRETRMNLVSDEPGLLATFALFETGRATDAVIQTKRSLHHRSQAEQPNKHQRCEGTPSRRPPRVFTYVLFSWCVRQKFHDSDEARHNQPFSVHSAVRQWIDETSGRIQ